ncbi:MAG: hypothetical protein QOD30_1663 [Actinomycetota bacterium]|nr:hypothetical protein [Actinomycetota bacterium]
MERAADEGDQRLEVPRFPSDVYVEVVRVLIIAMTTAVGDAVGGGPFAALGACCGYVLGGLLGRFLRRTAAAFEAHVQRTPAVTLAAGAIGALIAAAIGCIVGIAAVVLLPGRWGYPVLAIAAWTGVYAGFQAGVRKGVELRQLLGHGAIAVRDADRPGLVLVDSSAAMDGRLLSLARAGFLPGDLAVPRFVLDELQGLSDASDTTRRRRARRGLELLDVLRTDGPGLVVLPDEVPERDEVDAKLVALARRREAVILTADRGLAGVAAVEGIRVLDVASLADVLRAGIVPGEVVPLRLTREGRDPGQAIGFLEDGTMIVVHDAADRLGDSVEVEVSTSVPTSKGRLYFATIVS